MPWAVHDNVTPPPPPTPTFHPEMGYLCPSPHSRRVLRVGLISGACGLAFGAIAATALMSTPSPSATRAQSAATVGQATASGHADDAAAAVAPGVASAAQRPCSEQTW